MRGGVGFWPRNLKNTAEMSDIPGSSISNSEMISASMCVITILIVFTNPQNLG